MNARYRLQTSIYFTILYHIASLPFKTYLQKFDELDYHSYMMLCLAISVSSVFMLVYRHFLKIFTSF